MAKHPDASSWSQDRLDGALIHTADFGEVGEAIELLRAGANPNGYPLIMAIQARHPRCGKAMLSYGADPNLPYRESARGTDLVTPLNHTVAHRELTIVGPLLEGGADPNAMDSNGPSPLDVLTLPAVPKFGSEHYAAIRELLVSRGAE